MKRIHWKSSARTGKLKSRLYDRAVLDVCLIDLDKLVGKDTEQGLSQAAFLVKESIKAGTSIGMSYRGTLIPPSAERAHKRELLTRLAYYA